MTLVLPPSEETKIRKRGAEGYPDEICGILIGRAAHGVFRVDETRPMVNRRSDERRRRYVIDPLEVLAVEDELDAEGRDRRILGYYHSHPDHPAAPSHYDRDHAWPDLSYVILRVAKGRPEDLTSWRLAADRSRMVGEEVRTE